MSQELLKKLFEANSAHKNAAIRLEKATRDAFPKGCVISVTLGRARIVGEVIRSGGHWWSRPDEVTIRNIETGKERWFQATCDGLNIEFLGKHE